MEQETYTFDQLQVLELQMAARELEVELIGRYVHDPNNFPALREVLTRTFAELREIKAPRERGCPDDWLHDETCKCKPPFALPDS